MKRLQSLIPKALKAIDDKIKNTTDGKVASEMNGYISSFGASLINAGLLPTIIFFSQKGGSSGGREKLIPAIEQILNTSDNPPINLLDEVKTIYSAQSIDQSKINRLTEKITDAALVLKLALRTFPTDKKK